jgi:hypothetical protein
VLGQIRLAAYISRIETPEERNEVDRRYGQLIGNGDLQEFGSSIAFRGFLGFNARSARSVGV